MKKATLCFVGAFLVALLSLPGPAGAGEPAGTTVNGDVNCSGQLDLADAIFSLNYLFLGGEEPCPFAEPAGGGPEVAELEAELAGCNEALASREAELAARDDEIAALRAELTQTQVDLSGALRDLISTQRALLTAEARILELEAAEGPCGEQVDELTAALEVCRGDLEASGVELEESRQETETARLDTEAAREETEAALTDRDSLVGQLDECRNPRIDFTTVALSVEKDPGVSVLTGKLDLLRRISPTAPDAVLAQQEMVTFQLGTVSEEPGGGERALVYDTLSRALCSIDLCSGEDCDEEGRVKLHYTGDGLAEELAEVDIFEPFPALNERVPAVKIRVSRGPGQQRDDWTLAFEPRSRSIVAFRALDGYRPVRDKTWPDDDNFGRGNGLLMSVVISGAEIRSQLGLNSPPSVTRIVDLGNGQVLLFFDGNVLADVHLLELETFLAEVNPDLADVVDRPVWQLAGNFLLFGADDSPYLSAADVREVIQSDEVDIDGFQPFVNPADGSALVYESVSGQFLRVSTLGFEEAELAGRSEGQGNAVIEIDSESLSKITGLTDGTPEFSSSVARGNGTEIMLVEGRSNTVIAYDFSGRADGPNVTRLFGSEAITGSRLDPAIGCDPQEPEEPAEPEDPEDPGEPGVEGDGMGQGELVEMEDPVLELSLGDTLGGRLVYDRGRGELVSLNYATGQVVLVARGADLAAVTGGETVDLISIRNAADGGEDFQTVRAWDTASSSLIELDLESIEAELCQ
ncbi:MAG: hypothetical protein OSB83_02265 [Planctomycetota bacterium]|jgi:hypothetical protein|nr:hypothetical protein [Planctomycetota bacterium]